MPGAFNEPIEPTETAPGASETVEIFETTETTPGADETVEIQEGIWDETQSASDTRTEDPREQLQGELTSRMSEAIEIPAYQAVTPQKIATFNIEKLDWTNVSSWKA
jgi:hypothetical protein